MIDHIGGKLISIRRIAIRDGSKGVAVTLLTDPQKQITLASEEWSEMTVLVRAIEASGGLA